MMTLDAVTLYCVVTLAGELIAIDVHQEAAEQAAETWNELETNRLDRAVVEPRRYVAE